MVNNTTPNLGLQLPDPSNPLSTDVLRLISSLNTLDTAVNAKTTMAQVNTVLSESPTLNNPTYTGTLTGSTGVLNIGSGQVYKDASGNVGIGTSSPTQKLQVAGNQLLSNPGNAVYTYFDATSNSIGRKSTGELAITVAGGYPITFVNSTNEAMRVDASGNLMVGTSSQIIAPSKVTILADTGTFGQFIQCSIYGGTALSINNTGASHLQYFYSNGSVVGSIDNNATTTYYNTSSDQRLKTNIKPAGAATQSILDIPISQFDWLIDNSHQDFGGVAQDILPIIPEMVNVPEDSAQMMSVDWSKAVPRLIKTIQELNARLTALEAK